MQLFAAALGALLLSLAGCPGDAPTPPEPALDGATDSGGGPDSDAASADADDAEPMRDADVVGMDAATDAGDAQPEAALDSMTDAEAMADAAGDAEPDAEGDADADAGPPPALVVGRCLDATGADCLGNDGEGEFVALTEGDELVTIIGPQGAAMFVLALRARSIEPGDPTAAIGEDHPNVTITLVDDEGASVSTLIRRAAFWPVEDEEGAYDTTGLYLVLEVDAADVDGRRLTISALVRDRDGIEHETELDVVGVDGSGG